MTTRLADLRVARGALVKRMADLSDLDTPSPEQLAEFDAAEVSVGEFDARIARSEKAQALLASTALPVGQAERTSVPAAVEPDPYVSDKSLVMGGLVRLAAMAKGNVRIASELAPEAYGERHPVVEAMGRVKALSTVAGSAGGFVVPPDFSASIIRLLYPKVVMRKAGCRTVSMPNGSMTVPKMVGSSQAQWVGETQAPGVSQPKFGQVVAAARKLMALVPISNDMMRYATPEFDGKVRDDLVTQIALAEDAAFIRSLGTQYTPRGLKSFVAAGQTITSNGAFTLATVSQELGGLMTKLEEANIPGVKPCWIMRPRTKNYLINVQNANGWYVFKDEMARGTLLGWPFFTTTQIPNNLSVGGNPDCSELYAVDANECVIYESRQIELAISSEATYLDENNLQQNAFAQDMSLIRALTAEDFQMDHDEGVALLDGVRWAPTLQ